MTSDQSEASVDGHMLPEVEPDFAADLFGDRIETARLFVDALVREGELRGLIGPLEVGRLWTRHIVNSVLLAPLLTGRVADVGSGGGFPGLVVAIARPDLDFTLIEPMERRTDWLSEQVAACGLSNVTVLRGRAEEAPVAAFDTVTARAVGNLAKLLPMVTPLLAPHGGLFLLKGKTVADEIDRASKAISRAKLTDVRVIELGTELPTESTNVFAAKLR